MKVIHVHKTGVETIFSTYHFVNSGMMGKKTLPQADGTLIEA